MENETKTVKVLTEEIYDLFAEDQMPLYNAVYEKYDLILKILKKEIKEKYESAPRENVSADVEQRIRAEYDAQIDAIIKPAAAKQAELIQQFKKIQQRI